MKKNPVIGLDLSGRKNSVGLSGKALCGAFCCSIVDCCEISEAVDAIGHKKGEVLVKIDFSNKYVFNGRKKDARATVAILYDLVDGFVISGFDDPQTDIDPIVNARLYNDSYRPIYLELKGSAGKDDMDDLLSYCFLSSIDGLVTNDVKTALYLAERSRGRMDVFFTGLDSKTDVQCLLKSGVSRIFVRHKRGNCLLGSYRTLRKFSPATLEMSSSE